MQEGLRILRQLAGVSDPPAPQPTCIREVMDSGFRVHAETGELLGPHFVATHNVNSWDGEMFQYAREHRFRLLFRFFAIPMCRRAEVLETFLQLESSWELRKPLHDRIYFISQKLTAIQICRRLGIPHTVARFPIRDRKRLAKQLGIFEDLWAHRNNVTKKNGRTIIDHLGGTREAVKWYRGTNCRDTTPARARRHAASLRP